MRICPRTVKKKSLFSFKSLSNDSTGVRVGLADDADPSLRLVHVRAFNDAEKANGHGGGVPHGDFKLERHGANLRSALWASNREPKTNLLFGLAGKLFNSPLDGLVLVRVLSRLALGIVGQRTLAARRRPRHRNGHQLRGGRERERINEREERRREYL